MYLYIQPSKVVHLLREFTRIIDWAWRNLIVAYHAIGHGNAVVIFTERRSLMYDACTVCVRDIGINDNSKRSILKLR